MLVSGITDHILLSIKFVLFSTTYFLTILLKKNLLFLQATAAKIIHYTLTPVPFLIVALSCLVTLPEY